MLSLPPLGYRRRFRFWQIQAERSVVPFDSTAQFLDGAATVRARRIGALLMSIKGHLRFARFSVVPRNRLGQIEPLAQGKLNHRLFRRAPQRG
jgi:hypothetical protein